MISCAKTRGMLVVGQTREVLVVGQTKSDEVVGQTLRYLGWVKKKFGSKVRGIIIVNEPDERLEYALGPLDNLVELKFYKVNFEIRNKFAH